MNKLKNILLAGLLAVSAGCHKQEEPTLALESTPSAQIVRSTTNSPRSMINRFQLPTGLISDNTTNKFKVTIFQREGETFYVESSYYNIGEFPWFLREADKTTIDTKGNLISDKIYGIVPFKTSEGYQKTNITLSTQGPEGIRTVRYHELNSQTEDLGVGNRGQIVLDKHLTSLILGTNSFYTPGKSSSQRDSNSLDFYVMKKGSASFKGNGEIILEGPVYHPVKMENPSRTYTNSSITRPNIPPKKAIVGREK